MLIRNVRRKGLRRLMELDDGSGLPAASISKLRNILSFLQDMASEDELQNVGSWKAHELSGDRRGAWALHVTENWRLTFQIDGEKSEIIDLGYEDYH